MPLAKSEQPAGGTRWAAWHIEEPEEWFLSALPGIAADEPPFEALKGRLRLERLASRYLLWQLLGEAAYSTVFKDDKGRVHCGEPGMFIAVSHSAGYAAAIRGNSPVGIDIQAWAPKLERLAPKFMREDETASLSAQDPLAHLHVFWGAKEALFKAWGRGGIDFRANLIVAPFIYDEKGGLFEARIEKGDELLRFNLGYCLLGTYMLVYAENVDYTLLNAPLR